MTVRTQLLSWLAEQLALRGLRAEIVRPVGSAGTAVLRVITRRGRTRFIACAPAPQRDTWAWIWPEGWALVTDPGAVEAIEEAMR